LRGLLGSAFCALAWMVLAPEPALAWGPATHVALGEAVLASLYLLPPAVQALLERFPIHFLYGSVAADISFAKKYVPVGRHCHNWHVGEEILQSAETEALQAVGYGYLAHLAADTIAHNYFVPRQLLVTSTTQALGHTYWEHRMDIHVGEDYLGKARRLVIDHDHSAADALFDAVLRTTTGGSRCSTVSSRTPGSSSRTRRPGLTRPFPSTTSSTTWSRGRWLGPEDWIPWES